MATKRNLPAIALGTVAAGLDGFAASRDTNAGRSWNTPGVTATGLPILAWGWAPAVQVSSVLVGASLLATGHDSGSGALCAGVGLMARSVAFKLAQGRQKTPASAQGYAAKRFTTVAGMPAEIVRGRPGGRQHVTSVG